MKGRFVFKIWVMAYFILLVGALLPDNSQAAQVSDGQALQGLTEVHSIFDLNVGTPQELMFYLEVIQQTYDSLVAQNMKADCIVAVRGSAVRLITTENWSFSDEDQKKLEDAARIISELRGKGVRFEVCSVALEAFHVDPQTLIPEVQAVGNTFISLIGYQSRGYVLVPVK